MKKFFEKLLKYITYLFASLLLLSYLSVHISPEVFWPLAFLGLVYPYLLAVNAILFVFWLIKWKRIALVSLIIILVGFNHIKNTLPSFFGAKTELRNKDDNELKVLSYNVRAFNLYEWLGDPNTNKGIFNFIRSEHPDVICIQEYFTSNKNNFSPGRYSKLFGDTPYSFIEFSGRHTGEKGFGVAIFSRYPIINKGIVFKKRGNMALYSDILFDGDTIRIFNCHLQSVNFKARNYEFIDSLKIRYDEQQIRELQDISIKLKTAYEKRAAQAKILSTAIKNSPHPVVLCGDFNDTPVSFAYRKIKANMNDAWQIAGKGLGQTYRGRFSFRIDYIFYDPYFKAVDFERVKTQLSDHYPIMTILRKTGKSTNEQK